MNDKKIIRSKEKVFISLSTVVPLILIVFFMAVRHDSAHTDTLRRMNTNTNELEQHIDPSHHGIFTTDLVKKGYSQQQCQIIYTSTNISGHDVFIEDNPGGGTNCEPAVEGDATIVSYDDYGEVTANPNEKLIWVNAIGAKKFMEEFPGGKDIVLGTYRYSGEFRLPKLPAPDINQKENSEAVHFMIQLFDGSNTLLDHHYSLEFSILWKLNAWTDDYGKILVYTGVSENKYDPPDTLATQIELEPDTNWHSFEMIVDFKTLKWVSITIDGVKEDICDIDGAKVRHDDWGDAFFLGITTESQPSWPQENCEIPFSWTTQFRNLEFCYYNGSCVTGPDFNGDGIDDIIWRYHGAGGYNAVWLMEKNGINNARQLPAKSAIDFPFGSAALSSGEPTYSSVTDPRNDPKSVELLAVADQNWMLCGTGDFNGDCEVDIVWSNLSNRHNCVWYMDGACFSGYGQLPDGANTDWVLGGVGDFNRDGKPDLLWNNKIDGRNGVWLMDGVTLIETVIMTTSANLDWELCGTGDFDCDGQVDLVWRNASDGRNAVWYMDGTEMSSVGWLPPVNNLDWKLRGTGDFNNDGRTDLVWTNISDGRNCIWYMTGVTLTSVEFLTTVTDTDWKIEN